MQCKLNNLIDKFNGSKSWTTYARALRGWQIDPMYFLVCKRRTWEDYVRRIGTQITWLIYLLLPSVELGKEPIE